MDPVSEREERGEREREEREREKERREERERVCCLINFHILRRSVDVSGP